MLAPQPSGATVTPRGSSAARTQSPITPTTRLRPWSKTADSSGNPVSTDLACYSYNATNLRLLEEWDPRTASSSCLHSPFADPYTYTTVGKVSTVTPPGLAATITYGSTTGQVNNVHRTHSATYGGALQQTSFV